MSHPPDQLDTPAGRRLRKALRKTVGALPESTETIDGFGHTTFKVRKRSFVIAGLGDGGQALSIKAHPSNQVHLIRRGPWYRTPYIGHHGWVSIEDPLGHDWSEVEGLIRDAWRLAAPKRLAAQLPPD